MKLPSYLLFLGSGWVRKLAKTKDADTLIGLDLATFKITDQPWPKTENEYLSIIFLVEKKTFFWDSEDLNQIYTLVLLLVLVLGHLQ